MIQTLTARQIAEAFPEETLSIGRRELTKIKRKLKPVRDVFYWIKNVPCSDEEREALEKTFKGMRLPGLSDPWKALQQIIYILASSDDKETKERSLNWIKFNQLFALGEYSLKLERAVTLAENPPDPAEPIKTGLDIAKIAEAKAVPIMDLYQFEKVRRFGQKHKALCPFHKEKSGSFIIDQNNKFHCFGCGAHGTAVDFVMRQQGITFIEAVKQLAGGL